jgi:hypothetical protein
MYVYIYIYRLHTALNSDIIKEAETRSLGAYLSAGHIKETKEVTALPLPVTDVK